MVANGVKRTKALLTSARATFEFLAFSVRRWRSIQRLSALVQKRTKYRIAAIVRYVPLAAVMDLIKLNRAAPP
jgi:hypothetical protein